MGKSISDSMVSVAAACLLLMAFTDTAGAQVLYGSIVGNVKDSSDAAVAGAAVAITNSETGQTRQMVTNETGGYTFPTVQAGSYESRVTKEGFTVLTRSGVPVTINNITRVDIALRLGAVSESITVAAEGAVLQTDRAEVRAEITGKELVDLPGAPTRNYQYLLTTIPGVTPGRHSRRQPVQRDRIVDLQCQRRQQPDQQHPH